VARLAKDVRKKHNLGCHVKQIVIGADWRGAISVEVDGRLRTPISHLGLFAIMFAGIFTNVESISLQDVAWKSGDLHPDVFLHLSAFTSITQLHLKTVKFQSVTIFSRLITSLPNLETLVCWSNPSVGVFDPSSLSKFKSGWPRASKLSHLHLQLSPFQSRISNFEHPSAGEFLSQFLIATGWSGNLQKIRVDISSGASSDAESTYIQALLRSASGSLRNLTLLFDLDKGPEEDTIRSHLNLAGNINLQCLRLHVFCLSVVNDRGYNWLSGLLSQVGSQMLREISIILDVDSYWGRRDPAAMLSRLDHTTCSQIEDALCLPQFSSVRNVVFEYHYHIRDSQGVEEAQVNEAGWAEIFTSRFPRLYKRGILRTEVTVQLGKWWYHLRT